MGAQTPHAAGAAVTSASSHNVLHARPRKLRVLFLCTGNSCRSHMAEGFARTLHSGVIEAHSAGTRPQGLNPLAIRAMHEVGVDMSTHTSKHLRDVQSPLDFVVTVCDAANEACPTLPGVHIIHNSFDDPPKLARHATSDDEAMPHYRRVRDEIRAFVQQLPAQLLALSMQTHASS